MSEESGIKFFDYNAKGEFGDQHFNVKARSDGNHSHFVGTRAGISGDVTLVKAEKKLSEDVKVGLKGPSAGASLGFRAGTETGFAAMVEPSLVKAEGQVGPVVASVGLNANTGVKLNEEGFKFGVLGWGLTLGVGGKFTADTPFGSAGFAAPMTQQNTNQEHLTNTN